MRKFFETILFPGNDEKGVQLGNQKAHRTNTNTNSNKRGGKKTRIIFTKKRWTSRRERRKARSLRRKNFKRGPREPLFGNFVSSIVPGRRCYDDARSEIRVDLRTKYKHWEDYGAELILSSNELPSARCRRHYQIIERCNSALSTLHPRLLHRLPYSCHSFPPTKPHTTRYPFFFVSKTLARTLYIRIVCFIVLSYSFSKKIRENRLLYYRSIYFFFSKWRKKWIRKFFVSQNPPFWTKKQVRAFAKCDWERHLLLLPIY